MTPISSEALWINTLDVPNGAGVVEFATCRGKPPVGYLVAPVRDKIRWRVFISDLPLIEILPSFLRHPDHFLVLCPDAYVYMTPAGMRSEFAAAGTAPDYGFLNTIAQLLCTRAYFQAGYDLFVQVLTASVRHLESFADMESESDLVPVPIQPMPPTPPSSLVNETSQMPSASAPSNEDIERTMALMVENGPGEVVRHPLYTAMSQPQSPIFPTGIWSPEPAPNSASSLWRPSTVVPSPRPSQSTGNLRNNATPRNFGIGYSGVPAVALERQGYADIKDGIWSDAEEPQAGKAKSTGRSQRPTQIEEAGRKGFWSFLKVFRSDK